MANNLSLIHILCRTEQEIPENIREKLSLFCNVRKTSVIQNKPAACLYAVPVSYTHLEGTPVRIIVREKGEE